MDRLLPIVADGIAGGCLVGFGQRARGGHFPSDVIFVGLMIPTVAALPDMLRRRDDGDGR